MRLFPALRISQKVPLALVLSGVVVGAGVGLGSYLLAADSLTKQARQQLATIAFERANQVGVYTASVQAELLKTARSDAGVSAVAQFAAAYHGITDQDPAAALKQWFITQNPNEPGE